LWPEDDGRAAALLHYQQQQELALAKKKKKRTSLHKMISGGSSLAPPEDTRSSASTTAVTQQRQEHQRSLLSKVLHQSTHSNAAATGVARSATSAGGTSLFSNPNEQRAFLNRLLQMDSFQHDMNPSSQATTHSSSRHQSANNTNTSAVSHDDQKKKLRQMLQQKLKDKKEANAIDSATSQLPNVGVESSHQHLKSRTTDTTTSTAVPSTRHVLPESSISMVESRGTAKDSGDHDGHPYSTSHRIARLATVAEETLDPGFVEFLHSLQKEVSNDHFEVRQAAIEIVGDM
jgi:hypothetical protein